MTTELWQRLRDAPDLVAAASRAVGDPLAAQKSLRSRFDAELVPLALTLAEVRRKAAGRFSYADRLWSDPVRLEQATPEAVARHKALRFGGRVTDLCCGLGADAVAISGRGPVTAVDLDPVCGLFAAWNAEAAGVPPPAFECRDAADGVPTGLVHIDPDRRPGGHRVRRLEQYEPPLEFLQSLAGSADGGAIKVSPASNFGGKFPGCEVELVSLGGECKEATVWFGSLAGDAPYRATLLPTGETLAGDPLSAIAPQADLGPLLLDPDPSVVRSGLLDLLCERHGLGRLDDAEEYLTADAPPDTAFVTPFEVLDRCGNNAKQIRSMLKRHGVGPLEVKTRHVGADANRLQKSLQKPDGEPGVLFLARLAGRTHAVLCRRPARLAEPAAPAV